MCLTLEHVLHLLFRFERLHFVKKKVNIIVLLIFVYLDCKL
jgi:hypothetical protein